MKRRLKQAPATASAATPKRLEEVVEAHLPEQNGFDGTALLENRPDVTVKNVVVYYSMIAGRPLAQFCILSADT